MWATRIESALEDNRFVLFAQDIMPIARDIPNESASPDSDASAISHSDTSYSATGHPDIAANHLASRHHHCEILVRMTDRDGAIVPPMAFIPAAERYGLMPQIDRWVVKAFFRQYREVCPLSTPHGCDRVFAINLSGKSLSDESFFQFLERELTQSDLNPEHLCFEITETAAIANLSAATEFIHKLKQLGCKFALDDFGCGMSSFSYLKRLPVDYLKIDGSFIKSIDRDPIDRVMVESFIQIARVLGIQTIAEFVENEGILAILTELGADFAQGYGIGKPAPLKFARLNSHLPVLSPARAERASIPQTVSLTSNRHRSAFEGG
ncbi:MAG: EAL domain-containing protein [Cyanobacteria bacterium J06639_1]